MMNRLIRLANIALLVTVAVSASAVEKVDSASPTLARGLVFHDKNHNGKQDPGENGLRGVGVSNGVAVVSTDNQGRYAIPVDEDTALFVIKPQGWAPLTDANQQPRFYYLHKPKGSPVYAESVWRQFDGVAPTGPLPASVDFALIPQDEPQRFSVIVTADPQTPTTKTLEFLASDVVAELPQVPAAFGVTLGDIAADDLSLMPGLAAVFGRVGIPWHYVPGNHDENYDAPNDRLADESYEATFGPPYYAFDYGSVHFLALDTVHWKGARKGESKYVGTYYTGGLGERQLAFIRADLALVPRDRLVVLLMHIPLAEPWIEEDRRALFTLLKDRPHCLAIAGHMHTQEYRELDPSTGWQGAQPLPQVTATAACGSWWAGDFDEQGLPHATQIDGTPNGYNIFTFEGSDYEYQYRAARRSEASQYSITFTSEQNSSETRPTEIWMNAFTGSAGTQVAMRIEGQAEWLPMKKVLAPDPAYVRQRKIETERASSANAPLPEPAMCTHLWRASLPKNLMPGWVRIQVRISQPSGKIIDGGTLLRID